MSVFGGLLNIGFMMALSSAPAPEPPVGFLSVNQRINQIKNPSFEFRHTPGTGGSIPVYWSRFTGGDSTLAVSGMNRQGDHSFKIVDGSASTAVGLWSDPVPVIPGRVYTVRAWASRSSSGMDSRIYIKCFDADTNLVSTLPSQPVGSVGSWSEGIKNFVVPTDASYVRVLLYSGAASAGYAYFDCVSLVLADERVWDGDFSAAAPGQLPPHWSVPAGTPGSQTQETFDDAGNKILRIVDSQTDATSSAFYVVPATPGVPYEFSADVRRVGESSGDPLIELKFYDSSHRRIAASSAATSSTFFETLSVSAIAPEGTAYGKVFCTMGNAAVGTADFDNISFAENYVNRYVSSAGTGDGLSASSPAFYASSNFWSTVNAAASNAPVKVTFMEGEYTNRWLLSETGNADYSILIAGEDPFAINYTAAVETNREYILVYDCQNLTFRHFHFSAEEDQSKLDAKDYQIFDYIYAMRFGYVQWDQNGHIVGDRPAFNIRNEGLTFTGLLLMRYGATGANYSSHHIVWDTCSWAYMGWDAYDHCIYNANSSHDLLITNCYFQDANGAYVRFRNRSEGVVEDSTFLSTGVQPNGSPWGHVHHPFVQIAAVNPEGYTRDELLGTNFTFSGNSFTYENTSGVGKRCPYSIKVDTIAPTSHPDWFLVPQADGDKIADTSNSVALRNDLVEQYFGVDMANDFTVEGNSYSGCWIHALFTLATVPPSGSGYWSQNLWNDESMNCDIKALVGEP